MTSFKFALFILLAVFCRNSFAQEEFPLRELVFQGASGYRPGKNVEYFLFKHGFFRGVSEGEEAAMIAQWSGQHPDARVVPVSLLGEQSRLPIAYAWAVDGEENLNLFLVRKGVYPALAMLDTEQLNELLELAKNTRYGAMLKMQVHAGNPAGVPSRRLVPTARYQHFLKQLVAAEAAAEAESNGIWSDRFKGMRDKLGIAPLATTPLSILNEGSQ